VSTLILVEYQAQWPPQFREVAAEIGRAFAPVGVRVEHIGSTSVEGLCAKPVIDILLGAPSLARIEAREHALGELGFVYRPAYEVDLPERRYFVRPAGHQPRIHLHAVVRGGPVWQRHLLFRDALRGSRLLAEEYATLKRSLAALHANDKAAYTEAKGPFIARVLAGARPDRVRAGRDPA
jgi:GrpB-like predicted nucleotidyltransferase (UPF0157 family)